MPRKRRSYFLSKTGEHIAGSKVKRLTQDDQLSLMRHWFDDRYDPPDELPYDSSEGGFQWIWGGPYDARDVIENEFGGIASDKAIEELVSELRDINFEWSGKPSDEDFDDDYLADLIDSGTDPFLTLLGSMNEIESAAKIKTSAAKQKTLHKLLFANVITALETFLGDSFMKTLSGSDQYLEDFVFKTPHFRNTEIKLCDIFERFKKIDGEVRSYVLAHNWHMLKESGMMFKRAFDIKFPETPPTIANGIRERHDIVHRNGKTSDGKDGSWDLSKILALNKAILAFSGAIDDQVKKLPVPSAPKTDDPESPDETIKI
jgi:hypothetical protein